jgi:ATP-dependent DNA helicase RecQ
VHRPFAEEILRDTFELTSFWPNQATVVHAVLEDRRPLVVLPTGSGKSLCYQVPAVHGAQRLRGLTVVVSPLQALMADQVRALSARYPGSCFINSSLLQEERRRLLTGIRGGKYDIVYLSPERGRQRYQTLRQRAQGSIRARVHELFVYLQRDAAGQITSRQLVVLPTIVVS